MTTKSPFAPKRSQLAVKPAARTPGRLAAPLLVPVLTRAQIMVADVPERVRAAMLGCDDSSMLCMKIEGAVVSGWLHAGDKVADGGMVFLGGFVYSDAPPRPSDSV